jgi:hypothetical protein
LGGGAITDGTTDAKNASGNGPLMSGDPPFTRRQTDTSIDGVAVAGLPSVQFPWIA